MTKKQQDEQVQDEQVQDEQVPELAADAEESPSMSAAERDRILAGLEEESAVYDARGRTDRADQVRAEIKRLGGQPGRRRVRRGGSTVETASTSGADEQR